MRKDYVKPMMESEEFVANEYVATCWRIECNQSSILHNGKDNAPDRASYTVGGSAYKTIDDYIKSISNNSDLHWGETDHTAYKHNQQNGQAHTTNESPQTLYHKGSGTYPHCHAVTYSQETGALANAS